MVEQNRTSGIQTEPSHPGKQAASQNQYDILKGADALVIITEWNEYRNPDFDKIKSLLVNPLIFDGRNLYQPVRMKYAGFEYLPIGRNGKAEL